MGFLLALFAVGFLLGGIAAFNAAGNILYHIAGILCAIGLLLSLTANAVLNRLDRLSGKSGEAEDELPD